MPLFNGFWISGTISGLRNVRGSIPELLAFYYFFLSDLFMEGGLQCLFFNQMTSKLQRSLSCLSTKDPPSFKQIGLKGPILYPPGRVPSHPICIFAG